jgi:lysophospholipase L1-like esterase
MMALTHVALAHVAVHESPADGRLPLVAGGVALPVVVDADDHRVVAIAASALAEDVERVSGRKPSVVRSMPEGPAVIIGTLERSRTIRALVDAKKLDVADLQGQWESFKFVRVDDALVIVGSDRRGAAFGAFELSRAIGVSPWSWWADVPPPQRREAIYVTAEPDRVGPPSVKYRGIFLNDEDWGLQPWAAKTFEPETGDIGPKTYAKIFELLLRLKANYCWPAMHDCTRPFNAFPRNKQVADDYAIVMGSSHAEPMLRNNVGEWPHDQAEKWNPVTNLPTILEYWEARVRENGKFENVYTVGMRGVHDSGMPGGGTIDAKRERLEEIISLQREMLAKHVDRNVEAVPQIFCPYKEVLDIYRSGLKLPDDITIVWPDDNFGYIRQLPDERERQRGGGHGIYYHLSYWGRPHDYLWLESHAPALVWHEMTKAYELGARRLWVANVGDIKPIEAGMTLFLELAWKIDRYNAADISTAFLRDFYAEQFGERHGDAIADVKREYFRLCAIRKPEHMGFNHVYPNAPVRDSEFSHDSGNDEAMRFVEQWLAVAKRADDIAGRLAPDQRPAYFQLVQYPVGAAAAMAEKMICAERSRLLAARGDRAADGFADRAAAAYHRIEELTAEYNQQLDGKWRHMMNHRPRKLPVFDPPMVTRVNGNAAEGQNATAATSPAWQRPAAVVTVNVARPNRVSGGDVRWTILEGVGRRGAAIAPFPRTAKLDQNSADLPVAAYTIDIPAGEAEEYELVVEALPTQPLTARHELVCGVSIDDQPRQAVKFEQSSDERDRTWQQNILRNAMFGRTKLRAKPGRHILKLWALDPSVAVQYVTLNLATASLDATPAASATSAPAAKDAKQFVRKLSEGNYLVTIAFGSDAGDSETTVKAESRRLMLERVAARAGETVTRTFAVNIRTPKLTDGGSVRLNARETDAAHWDDQLTLEFLGDRAAVRSVDVKPAPTETITLYLAGDSTVTDQMNEPWAGWGQMLPRFFKPRVAVANHAESGRALRSFRSEKRLDKILGAIKPGDYVFIQFGHNDMKEKGEGVGAFTTYKADLKKYIAAARERGAHSVVVTSMHRRRFDSDGKIVNTFGDYIEAAREAAAEEKTPLIDLNAMSQKLYEAWGPQQSKRAFVHYPAGTFPGQDEALKDDTHFNAYGGYELAKCVVEGIRAAKLSLAEHLVDDVRPFDPAKPDSIDTFAVPPSPARASKVPEGR